MNVPDQPLSREVLERARAYVRVDQQAVAAAILLAQFARADGSPGIGEEMLQHANRIAQRALRYVGATVLVVDPFDSDTAEMWQQRFGFQDSEQPVPGSRSLRRQWLSLQS